MKLLKLYIAASLDNYNARPDGSLDWLTERPNPEQSDFGYQSFYDTIDTIIMGRKTYEEVLSFGVDWPYTGKDTYVVTSDSSFHCPTPDTSVVSHDVSEHIANLRHGRGQDIWLVGGGGLIETCLNAQLIDELIITLIPVVLGNGIPLFRTGIDESEFRLLTMEAYSGNIVALHYSRI